MLIGLMAKVLLVNPPFYRLLGSKYNANSLGIAYIASYLNKEVTMHGCIMQITLATTVI